MDDRRISELASAVEALADSIRQLSYALGDIAYDLRLKREAEERAREEDRAVLLARLEEG